MHRTNPLPALSDLVTVDQRTTTPPTSGGRRFGCMLEELPQTNPLSAHGIIKWRFSNELSLHSRGATPGSTYR